jgi:hypothetical protein
VLACLRRAIKANNTGNQAKNKFHNKKINVMLPV